MVAIPKIARRFLKIILFIALFCIVSKIGVPYFSAHPLIGNDTVIKMVGWFNSNPTPEDIYYMFDYVMIGLNVIASMAFYFIIMKLITTIRSN